MIEYLLRFSMLLTLRFTSSSISQESKAIAGYLVISIWPITEPSA